MIAAARRRSRLRDRRARRVRSVAGSLRVVSLGAERARRLRALRAAGKRCYTVTLQVTLEETLRKARNFTEAQLADYKAIGTELSEVLELWFERWARLK